MLVGGWILFAYVFVLVLSQLCQLKMDVLKSESALLPSFLFVFTNKECAFVKLVHNIEH